MTASNHHDQPENATAEFTLDFHLLGVVSYQRVQELQRRLVATAAAGGARSTPVLICEHPHILTVGREGSRAHIRLSNEQLQRRNLEITWLSRGGGCLLHAPGQLCIYPIVPLQEVGWTVGEYMRRLQFAIMKTITKLNLPAMQRPGSFGVWGRTGLLAAIGVKVQDWIAHQGAFLNVAPDMSWFGYIDTASEGLRVDGSNMKKLTMSCLVAERRGAINMSSVRTSLIESFSQTWGTDQYHIHAGHPWLVTERNPAHRSRELAG